MSLCSFSKALCPDLSYPANGVVTVMGTSVGDTASYTCNDGYELIGSMSVTCTSDGTWSDEPPMCRRKQFKTTYILHTCSYISWTPW